MHESMFVKRNENGGNDVGLTGHTPFFFSLLSYFGKWSENASVART